MNIPYDAVEAAHIKLTHDIFKIPRNGCLVLKINKYTGNLRGRNIKSSA